ncbi:MAG: CPBP family intramembrane metalloprotease, partial [Planctomycetes bacterium]|nr:CPBP family intramembrane metalloprotease [Planctomycetota bacterium]
MSLLSSIIAQAEGLASNPQDIIVIGVCAAGVFILVNWLVSYSGPAALAFCPVRRNNMPVYLPLIAIGVWLTCVAGASLIITKSLVDVPDWLQEFSLFLGMTIIELVMIGLLLFIAWHRFARRLKGFGLHIRTVGGDMVFAVVNFIAVYPLVLVLLWAVVWIGEFIAGPGFEMQINEGLTALTDYDKPGLKVLVIFFAVIVVPVFEEMLFRGFLQSMLTGFIGRPWPAILIASFAFASMHPWMHLPALFVLSMALGYAYEKSGSLLRPIFIH